MVDDAAPDAAPDAAARAAAHDPEEETERRRGRPPRYAPAERERRILDAMERVVAAAGLAGASMDAIAREAGMSKRTVYGVFKSRDALFDAWVRRARASVVRPLAPPERQLALADRLERLLRREVEGGVAAARFTVLRAVVAEAERQPELARALLREGADAARAIVRAELERAIAAGEITVEDPAAAAALLCDMVHPSPLDRLLDPDRGPPSRAEASARLALAVDTFLNGVRRGDGPSRTAGPRAPRPRGEPG
jgi:AcrR family transcriptional regulator